MMRRHGAASLLLLVFGASCAYGQDIEHLPGPIHHAGVWKVHDDVRWSQWRNERAGFPLTISRWAEFTYGSKYQGYYVGGGTPPTRFERLLPVEPRYPHEGTWGMDYAPSYSLVELFWTHGRRYQGGAGQYEPDRRNRPFRLQSPPAE